jgi:hypothetical protein
MNGREEYRILTECWREKKKNTGKKDREKYYQRNGYTREEVERLKEQKEDECSAEWKRRRHRQPRKKGKNQRIQIQQEVWEVYDRGKISEYLGGESVKQRKMMARFRCGHEERESRYWMEGEERKCRMCFKERETIKHMWNGCREMRERKRKEWGEILNEDGRETR